MADEEIYRAIVAAQEAGEAVALATVIRTRGAVPRRAGSRMLVYPDGRILGTVGGGGIEQRAISDAHAAIEDGQTRVNAYSLVDPDSGDVGICGGTSEIFIEPLLPDPIVLVIGCGHVGKAVAALAKWVGFRVAVSDDRAEFCTPDIIPDADIYLPVAPDALAQHIVINRQTYIAALTRGVDVDVELLPALLESPAPYIGLIGSRRRWSMTVQGLQARGVTPEQIARVRSPIGLELNAETPREIAVSIMAEIIMVMHGGTGAVMKITPSAPREG